MSLPQQQRGPLVTRAGGGVYAVGIGLEEDGCRGGIEMNAAVVAKQRPGCSGVRHGQRAVVETTSAKKRSLRKCSRS